VTKPGQIAAIARAFDVDPQDIRADTPVAVIGWTGSATNWLVAADHLGLVMSSDPPEAIEVATIADIVAIVTSSAKSRPNYEA
jgi:hypothetical protein